jgi:predicted nucleic acid-binding Zn ribbon protein
MGQKMAFSLGRSIFTGGMIMIISTCIRFSQYPSWNYFSVFSLVLIGVILIVTGFIIQKKAFKMNEGDDIIADFSDVNQSESVSPSNSRRANFCTACGTPITLDATVCSKCGKQI